VKVLVAEDDYTSSRVMEGILSPVAECEFARDGKAAIEMFRKALEDEDPFDLVCLDIMMPEVNGQDVLKEIRNLEREFLGKPGRAKVIMTTALAGSGNVTRAFEEECDAYLVKPIRKEKLLAEISSFGLLPSKASG